MGARWRLSGARSFNADPSCCVQPGNGRKEESEVCSDATTVDRAHVSGERFSPPPVVGGRSIESVVTTGATGGNRRELAAEEGTKKSNSNSQMQHILRRRRRGLTGLTRLESNHSPPQPPRASAVCWCVAVVCRSVGGWTGGDGPSVSLRLVFHTTAYYYHWSKSRADFCTSAGDGCFCCFAHFTSRRFAIPRLGCLYYFFIFVFASSRLLRLAASSVTAATDSFPSRSTMHSWPSLDESRTESCLLSSPPPSILIFESLTLANQARRGNILPSFEESPPATAGDIAAYSKSALRQGDISIGFSHLGEQRERQVSKILLLPGDLCRTFDSSLSRWSFTARASPAAFLNTTEVQAETTRRGEPLVCSRATAAARGYQLRDDEGREDASSVARPRQKDDRLLEGEKLATMQVCTGLNDEILSVQGWFGLPEEIKVVCDVRWNPRPLNPKNGWALGVSALLWKRSRSLVLAGVVASEVVDYQLAVRLQLVAKRRLHGHCEPWFHLNSGENCREVAGPPLDHGLADSRYEA
ncbi:unnamed protein product [Soboliphyme baturini]|uniref:Transmembrane protein n=1 Tax=Soboliphyme baturini TaxID=241478 RepID=A0A183ID89_9BILA|nr:unnamed protein product [Soboliphyme baturini]